MSRPSNAAVSLPLDPSAPNARPLCVDLDGTLVQTDLLHESALLLLKRNPLNAFRLAVWTLRGKTTLKTRLAAEVEPDYPSLPYRRELLEALAREKTAGRRLVLVTASHQTLADGVARHLEIFDEVHGTDPANNLSGSRKADRLVERFGEKGFDYVGDHPVDLPVWKRASAAWVVGPHALARRVDRATPVTHLPPKVSSRLKVLAKALRVHQWAKNVLVFLPVVTAFRFTQTATLAAAGWAFAAFSLCASSVYVLNDLLDLEADREHPTKRNRPFAAGTLSIPTGLLLLPVLLGAGLTIAASVSSSLLAILGAYFALNLAYTFKLKQVALIDVLCLAGLYTVRIFAGSAATSVPISPWLLAFSMFFFISLALVKRCAELELKKAKDEKKVKGRGYRTSDLEIIRPLGTSAGYLAVLVFALYIHSGDVSALYSHPERLWLITPLVLYWISRVWLLTHRGEMNQDPVLFAVKDRASYVVGAIAVALALWAR